MKPLNNNLITTTDEFSSFYEHIKSLGVNLTIEDFALVVPFLKTKKIKKGTVFVKFGEINQEVYYSIKGMARSFYQLPNGTEKTYFIITEHKIFADYVSILSQTPATENIEAIEDMQVYCISYADLLHLSTTHHIWETIIRNVSDFNHAYSQKRLRSMMNDDAATRYNKFLKHSEGVAHRIPQHIIASYLGITPQSFSRLKKEVALNV